MPWCWGVSACLGVLVGLPWLILLFVKYVQWIIERLGL